MGRYKLTGAAERDFEAIFEFGIDRFGLTKALDYQRAMIERFDLIAAQPALYQAVDHIKQGYRRSVFEAHSIYYKIDGDLILIVRILSRQDLSELSAD